MALKSRLQMQDGVARLFLWEEGDDIMMGLPATPEVEDLFTAHARGEYAGSSEEFGIELARLVSGSVVDVYPCFSPPFG